MQLQKFTTTLLDHSHSHIWLDCPCKNVEFVNKMVGRADYQSTISPNTGDWM
jgi:hypothetical protein